MFMVVEEASVCFRCIAFIAFIAFIVFIAFIAFAGFVGFVDFFDFPILLKQILKITGRYHGEEKP